MPQDAFTLRLVAKELDHSLSGGKINKITQPAKEDVALLIYTGKRTLKLILSTNASECGAYFCEEETENPLTAPAFCMLLRKYIQGAELLSVEQVGFERILLFRMRCISDFSSCERVLCCEIMGKYSNLLLLENGTILGALKTTPLDDSTRRVIFPGMKYAPPAPQEKADPTDPAALKAALDGCDSPKQLFLRVKGIALSTAEQIYASYSGGDLSEHVRAFLFSNDVSPCVLEQGGVPSDFYARAVAGGIPFASLSEAQSYFYGKKRAAKSLETLRRRLLSAVQSALKKQEKRLAVTLEKQLSCRDMEENRKKGELLTANIYALSKGMKGCEVQDWYQEGATVKIILDPRLTPAENAQAYFKKYRKQKRTLEALAPQQRETETQIEYLKSLLAALSSGMEEDDLRSVEEELMQEGFLPVPQARARKQKREIPFRTYECGGMKIFAGRNNLQNDALLRKSAPDDIWLHAQKYHSCHAVIKSGGAPVSEETLAFAAGVCALYSDGGGEKIPVDYCAVKFVKKPRGAKAGFVTYSSFSTTLGDPAKVK